MAEPRIAIDILVNCQSATGQLKNFNKELNKTVEGGKKATNWLSRGFGKLITAYFGVRTAQNIFNTAQRMQLLEKSIKGLTKSTQDWDFIQRQAFEKGIDIEVVAKGYRNFFSAAKMAGFTKEGIQGMYADVLLSVRAIGASTQQTEGALLALEQMLSKGKVSMEELRRQLGNALPGAFEIGAKAMNMTTMEFNDFVKTGNLASSEFVPRFVKQLKTEYAGGFGEIAETLSFATTRLSVAWKIFSKNIFEGETGKNMAKAIDSLARLIISPEFQNLATMLGKILDLIVKIFSWLVKNIELVIVLLGFAGATKVTIMFAKALDTMGVKGVEALTKISKATMILFAKFLLIFGLVAAIQDLIYGIFLPSYTDSLTEDLLRKLGIIQGQEGGGFYKSEQDYKDKITAEQKQGFQGVADKSVLYVDENGVTRIIDAKHFKNRFGGGYSNWSDLPYAQQEYMKKNYSYVAPTQLLPKYQGMTPIDITKTLGQSLTIGDVTIHVEGSKDPLETGKAVFNQFVGLSGKYGITLFRDYASEVKL